MAKKKQRRGQRPLLQRHPWSTWFNGKRKEFELHRHKDFNCMTHSMVSQIRGFASRNKISISVQTYEDCILVVIRN